MSKGKTTFEEYFNSPERQRQIKIDKEALERAAFEQQMAFKRKQAENPIKGKPRKKRKKNR